MRVYDNIGYLYRRWLKVTKSIPIPTDVHELFTQYAGDNPRMTTSQLVQFLVQHDTVDEGNAEKAAQAAIKKINGTFKPFHKEGLNERGFLRFLLKKTNQPLISEVVDENAPLAHYFWNTGHASYLYTKYDKAIQDGLAQPHTIIISSITKALKNGVRVIELDLWPEENHAEICLRQEGMPNSSVPLKKCLLAIKENAFSTSNFPVILILVDHLGDPSLRAKAESRIEQTLGNIRCPPNTKFNCLGSLKKKIIISIRLPNQSLKDTRETHSNITEPAQNESEIINRTITDDASVTSTKDLEKAYKRIVTIPMEKMDDEFRAFSETDPNNVKLLSLHEDQLEYSRRTQAEKIVRFTQDNILAVYLNPPGTHTFSRNCDPCIGWIHGAQVVACYMQVNASSINEDKEDFRKNLKKYLEKYAWIEQGMFRAYGTSGYFKKPDILLDKNIFKPTEWQPVKKILQVKVYLGTGWHLDFESKEFDSTSPPDFFAAIEIVGVPEDEATEKTLPAMDQWIPEWNQEFEFPLTVPELALLVIKVSEFDADRTHDFGGQTCLPVSKLRNGIRAVPLYGKDGKRYRTVRLLVHFKVLDNK